MERREYTFSDGIILGNENDVCMEMEMEEYTSSYFCDMASEVADNHVPIYTSDIWEYVNGIKEYVEQAISEGLCHLGSGVDLTDIFKAGYYVYYKKIIYENMENIVYNVLVDYLNDNGIYVCEEVESIVEELVKDFDNNDCLDDALDALVERLNNTLNELVEQIEELDEEE